MIKTYSFTLAIFPILLLYDIPGFGLNAAVSAALLFAPLMLIKMRNFTLNRFDRSFIRFMLYIFFITMIYVVVRPNLYTGISVYTTMALRATVLIVLLHMGTKIMLDISFMRKAIEFVSVIAVAYLIMQCVAYYSIRVILPKLPTAYMSKETYDQYQLLYRSVFRPSSFFLEPAHFSQYVVVALASSLFPDEKAQQLKWKKAAWYTIGIVLSTSGIGIISSIVVWGLYLLGLISQSDSKKNLRRLLGILCIACIVIPIVLQFDFFQTAIQRIFTGGITGKSSAIDGRMRYTFLYEELPLWEKVFGHGIGTKTVDVYFTGLIYLLYSYGIVGTALFFGVLYNTFRNTEGFYRCMSLVYVVLITSGSLAKFVNMGFYLSLIFAGYRYIKKQKLRPSHA